MTPRRAQEIARRLATMADEMRDLHVELDSDRQHGDVEDWSVIRAAVFTETANQQAYRAAIALAAGYMFDIEEPHASLTGGMTS